MTRGLPDEYSDAYAPEIAAGAGGAIHLAFWDQVAGNDVAYRRLRPGGAGFGPVLRLGNLGLNHRQAGSTNAEAGDIGVDRRQPGDRPSAVRGKCGDDELGFLRPSLLPRAAPTAASTLAAFEQVGTTTMAAMPRFVYSRGRVHAAWTDFRDNNIGGEIYARYRDLQQLNLIDHFYQSILNRTPDAPSKIAWENEMARVQAQGLDPREMLLVMSGYFFNSLEYQFRNRNNTQFATDLYMTFFRRTPDGGGLAFWVAQLDAGEPRDMVRHAFGLSSEYDAFARSLYGRTDSRAENMMISDFYRVILNRLASNAEFSTARGRMRTAQCGGVAQVKAEADATTLAFFASTEYQQRGRDNVGYMQDLYLTLMRRYATLYELWSWTNALNNLQYTREQVRQIFIGSYEFQLRLNRVVQEGCLR